MPHLRHAFLSLALVAAAPPPPSFLAPGSFDVTAILPPAPQQGDARYDADRAIFRETRKLQGTPRWAMATNDVKLDTRSLMKDFSCAAGLSLRAETLPRLTALLAEASHDTAVQTGAAKHMFKRLRPFLIDNGPTCQPASDLAGSYDYPSGHTTMGWTWAQVLADALPERATPILARGRAFGQSRFICGAHNESAVDAGFLSASATMTAVRATAAYQAALAAAREELRRAAADAPAPSPATCAAEAALVAAPVPE